MYGIGESDPVFRIRGRFGSLDPYTGLWIRSCPRSRFCSFRHCPGSFGPWIWDLFYFGSGMEKSGSRIRDKLTVRTFTSIFTYIIKSIRSHKTVENKVFLNFLLVDGRILIRSNNSEGLKTYGSYGIPDP
jgi:hypothetical protein